MATKKVEIPKEEALKAMMNPWSLHVEYTEECAAMDDIAIAKLLKELDKGIDDMENDRTIPHEEAMRSIKEFVDTL